MKKFLLSNFMIILLAGVLFSTGCKEPEPVAPPPFITAQLFLEETTTFLAFCGEAHDGEHKLDLEVTILGYTGDPNNPGEEVGKQYKTITNDEVDLLITPISIELPNSGTYLVQVSISGWPDNCFDCCTSRCSIGEKGRPRYSGVSGRVNSNPPPGDITIKPEFEQCTNCGC